MKEDTRNKILDISLQLTKKYGFWSFKVEDILQYAHISRATFYKYFKNKEDVQLALFDDELYKIELKIKAALEEQSDPFNKLRAFFLSDITGMRELLHAVNIRIGEIDISPGIPKKTIEQKGRRDFLTVRDILSEGVAEGSLVLEDLDITAHAVLGMGRGIGIVSAVENKNLETVQREIDISLKTLFVGIANKDKKYPFGPT